MRSWEKFIIIVVGAARAKFGHVTFACGFWSPISTHAFCCFPVHNLVNREIDKRLEL